MKCPNCSKDTFKMVAFKNRRKAYAPRTNRHVGIFECAACKHRETI